MKNQKQTSAFSANDSLALKGIAIILMMFHHCFMEPARFAGYSVDFSPFSQELIVKMSSMFKICVPIFAFISGYGLYLSAKNKCDNFKSAESWSIIRLFKTLSGFWFVYVLVFISTWIYASYPQKIYCTDGMARGAVWAVVDFLGLANLIGTPTLVSTWWYMSAAILFIIAVPIFIKWTDKLGTISLIVAVVALPRLLGAGYLGGINAYTFIFALLLGLIFAKYDLFKKIDNLKIFNNKNLNAVAIFILMIVIVAVNIYLYYHVPTNKLWEYKYGIYPVIIICFCKKYIIKIPILTKVLAFFGKHSMNVFLIHTFIRSVFFRDFTYGFGHFLLIVAVLFGISLAISVIIIEPLKKLIRYDKLINKLIERFSVAH